MATKAELVSYVSGLVRDSSFNSATILGYLNRAQKKTAGGIVIPPMNGIPQMYWGRFTPPLPELATTGALTTTSNAYVSMTSTYQRGLFLVVSDDQDDYVNIYSSWVEFLKKYPELSESGQVDDVCLKGRTMYYQGIPSSADTLTWHGYAFPTDMSEDDDTPDGFPEHLHYELIGDWSVWQLFEVIEDALEGPKKNAEHWKLQYMLGCCSLIDFLGPEDGEPEYVNQVYDDI